MRLSKSMAILLIFLAVVSAVVGTYFPYLAAQQTRLDFVFVMAIIGYLTSTLLGVAGMVLSLYESGPKIQLRVECGTTAKGSGGSSLQHDKSRMIYNSWHVPFVFYNEGDREGRVLNSTISVSVTPALSNVKGAIDGFGPGNARDFLVRPGCPIIGTASVRIQPEVPGPGWDDQYREAVKAGRVSVKMRIEYSVQDVSTGRSRKGQPTVLDAELKNF